MEKLTQLLNMMPDSLLDKTVQLWPGNYDIDFDTTTRENKIKLIIDSLG